MAFNGYDPMISNDVCVGFEAAVAGPKVSSVSGAVACMRMQPVEIEHQQDIENPVVPCCRAHVVHWVCVFQPMMQLDTTRNP